MSSTSAVHPLDFTFRVIESVAFSLHAVLGVTEPITGCLRGAFGDHNNMVWWGWPVAGCLLAFVAYGNFRFQQNNNVLMALQWYIVTFHFGAIWYHIRIGHSPLVGMAPGFFIPIALTVIGIRYQGDGLWYIIPLGTFLCAAIAHFLCRILVKPQLGPNNENTDPTTFGGGEQALLPPSSARGTTRS